MTTAGDGPVQRAEGVQHRAADPSRSVALEAAAGAGKTKVLVDRYLRLCLTDPGADPRGILAITFTRKATVEILERLQHRARELASQTAAARTASLADLFGRQPTAAEVDRAAWLHEALLEDPAGLGITTLHGFCQRVLGRFAAEAGLDPRFEVLDERRAADYQAEALDALEAELARDPAAAAAYAGLADTMAGARRAVADVMGRRMHLQRWLDRVVSPPAAVAAALARPLAPHADALIDDLRRALIAGTVWEDDPIPGPADGRPHDQGRLDVTRLAPPLADALARFAGIGLDAVAAADEPAGGPTDGTRKALAGMRAEALASADRLAIEPAAVSGVVTRLRDRLLTRDHKLRRVRGRKLTDRERHEALARAVAPVLALAGQLGLADLLRRNATLLRCGLRALDLLADARRRDRVVDFEDLEYLALRLLRDPELGGHLHHRLDARLDHVLLDEFQDTNRNQWELLRPLLEELLAGGEPRRTVFVVGDVKQSIYGFRGAEPGVFGAARLLLESRLGKQAGQRLPTNFRSLPAVVRTVGDLCQQPPLADHLGAEAESARQDVAREVADGDVVLVEPFDGDGEASGHDRAGEAVVALVRHLLATGTPTWERDAATRREVERPLRYQDILVLARSKTHLASYEEALRRAGIPYVPAGRGLLARSREVQDVLQLLRWLSLPADDTAGATVLRSPLVRLPEPRVQALLAARRTGRRRSLLEVLLTTDDPALAPLRTRLGAWAGQAGLLPLHDLLRRIYREGDVLARMETARGEQARFNLLRLLDLALAAEARGGSLRDFVAELEQAARLGGEEEGTLPGEADHGRVRVMTVHGAKGLEAPVVILADAAAPLKDSTPVMALGADLADGPWVFGVGREHHTGPLVGPPDERLPAPLDTARARTLGGQLAEEAHVLYVALTRARDRLYVLGGRNQGGAAGAGNYLAWLAAAGPSQRWLAPGAFLQTIGAPGTGAGAGTEDAGTETAGTPNAAPAVRAGRALARLEIWTPPPLTPRLELVPPSQLAATPAVDPATMAGAAAQPAGGDAIDAMAGAAGPRPSRRDNPATRRGTRIHGWLEAACRLGEMPPAPADPGRRDEWEEARALLTRPELAWVFRPTRHGGQGLSEVPVVHRLPGRPGGPERRVTGFIDRLVVRPDRVDIIDYKSNRLADQDRAALLGHYRPQLQAYREALAPLYPHRSIRCWLLWTDPFQAAAPLEEVP